MKSIIVFILVVGLVFVSTPAKPQGFLNLDFEHPLLPLNPNGASVDTARAIPSWTAYIGGVTKSTIFYNGVSGGGALIALEDTNNIDPKPIQGNYSVYLGGDFFGSQSAAIGQTGQIPNSALSVLFYVTAYNTMQVSFNSQSVSLFLVSSNSSYVVMGGDVSAFAGQTGELLFTKPPQTAHGLIDNIQFSSSPIPEPSTLALAALGGLLVGLCRCKK